MNEYTMLIDYGLCTGCKSCEISCRNEKGFPLNEWGIKIIELGPEVLGGTWEWDYLPAPSRLCDLCIDKVTRNETPPCVLHCLSNVIEIVETKETSKRLAELDKQKLVCYIP